jgi:hypothetical protein
MNELDLMRTADPSDFVSSAAAREELLAAITSQPIRRRRRRTFLAGSTAVLTLAGGGLAYAVLSGQSPQTALKVNCGMSANKLEFERDHAFTTVLDTATGDPVADCAAVYQRQEGVVPPLVAYDAGSQMIYVIPETWTPPKSWRRLSTAFRTDAARLELQQRLADLVDEGPYSQCLSEAQAQRSAEVDLAALHLSGWAFRHPHPDGQKADGRRSCAWAEVDENGSDSILIGTRGGDVDMNGRVVPPAAGHAEVNRLADHLRVGISDACLDLPHARAVAQQAIEDTGFTTSQVQIHELVDRAASCTRVDLVPGGVLDLILRGPQRLS